MEAYKVEITTWTSSFRYPNIISGFQPTLEVPPLSTVLGMINAAAGRYMEHIRPITLAYYFEYETKATDLETIYQIEAHEKGFPKPIVKSNVLQKEFLFNTRLLLYLSDKQIADYFRKPVYPLLLGRSSDLATAKVSENPVNLSRVENASKIKGQVIPYSAGHCLLPGDIQALPKYFTNDIPRNNLGTEPYAILNYRTIDFQSNISAYSDILSDGREIHLYFHTWEKIKTPPTCEKTEDNK